MTAHMHKSTPSWPGFVTSFDKPFFVETLVWSENNAIIERDIGDECTLEVGFTSLVRRGSFDVAIAMSNKVLEHSKTHHVLHFWFHVLWTHPKHVCKCVPSTGEITTTPPMFTPAIIVIVVR